MRRPNAGSLQLSFTHSLSPQPVAEVDRRRVEAPRLDQLEVEGPFEGREVGGASAEDDRDDEQSEVVDEAGLDQGRSEAGATDREVLSWFLLQPGGLLDRPVLEQPGAPLDLL